MRWTDRGGRNTTLQALCDEKGRPCVLLLTPGTAHDCKVAQLRIEAMPPSKHLAADKVIYKRRNVIERMFCRFKDWRGIATRFD